MTTSIVVKRFAAMVVACSVLICSQIAYSQVPPEHSWINPDGGDFEMPYNWSPFGVPSSLVMRPFMIQSQW